MHSDPVPGGRVRGLVCLAMLSLAGVGEAYDLWLVAGKYRLAPREISRMFVNNGDLFPNSLTLLGEHRLTKVSHHGPRVTRPITAFRVDGESLSFDVRVDAVGSHVLALGTHPRVVRLSGEEFRNYLEESGLERVLALREEADESAVAAIERYSKWAKAVLDVGGVSSDERGDADGRPAWAMPVGHRIEIVPTRDPNSVLPGEDLEIQVLFEGQPLAEAPVVGGTSGGSATELRVRTDERGLAVLTIPTRGRWYLRSIHMIRAEDDPDIGWESFWCTLTFESRDPIDGSP